MRAAAVIVFSALVSSTSLQAAQRITREQAARVVEEYAIRDSAGYLCSHSGFYPRTFARALAGDRRALRRVFRDSPFHSGDNEAWCSIPGAILYVIGDDCFSAFAASLSATERWWALIYIPDAEPFHYPDPRRGLQFFQREFPKTYRLYIESDRRPRPN